MDAFSTKSNQLCLLVMQFIEKGFLLILGGDSRHLHDTVTMLYYINFHIPGRYLDHISLPFPCSCMIYSSASSLMSVFLQVDGFSVVKMHHECECILGNY